MTLTIIDGRLKLHKFHDISELLQFEIFGVGTSATRLCCSFPTLIVYINSEINIYNYAYIKA